MGGRRGRLINAQDKHAVIELIQEACDSGSRLRPACQMLSIAVRTLQRWKKQEVLEDKRRGSLRVPRNKLTEAERSTILQVVNSLEYRNQPPSQIVPNLADKGQYLASESTIYRILHQYKMMRHRNASRPRVHQKPAPLRATRPNQLWSWDITYMTSTIRGKYFYLYLFLDVFSRKIVGFNVFDEQSAEHASDVVSKAYMAEGISPGDVTLHADNGGPMKGAMMLATLQNLGVVTSFSRPSVSNDNPYSEAMFRTLKYCPKYPDTPFTSAKEALAWVKAFVDWYNNMHLHSGIKFVTPIARHNGQDHALLVKRSRLYALAKQKHPLRWTGKIRNWDRTETVYLNHRPNKVSLKS